MSALRHTRPPPALPDTAEFTPAEAEKVIRRAIRMHDRKSRSSGMSIDVMKQTLASVGVAPDALHRAAMELRDELRDAPRFETPSSIMWYGIWTVVLAAPGVALIWFHRELPMRPWVSILLGVGLLFLLVRSRVRGYALWRRSRALYDDAPEE
jgi:hypothetical protein